MNQAGDGFQHQTYRSNNDGRQDNRDQYSQSGRHNGRGNNSKGVLRIRSCRLCEPPGKFQHWTDGCPYLDVEKDIKKIKEKCIATKTCTRCLRYKHDDKHQCGETALKYNTTCNTHKVCTKICKCVVQPPQNNPPTQVTNNVNINKSVLGCVGFNTERITVYSGNRSRQVLVTYDSYASHSSITPELVRELGLKQFSVGMLDIQHFLSLQIFLHCPSQYNF